MPNTDSINKATEIIQTQVQKGILDAATLYVRIGDSVEQRSFGAAESEDSIFLIASITKPMSATGVMILVDRGELELSDRVMKFIPEFSESERKEITVEQLLTHTSGLPDQLPENAELRRQHAPLDEFIEKAIRTPLLFTPGTRYSYQSMGILLAAEIVRRITGIEFPAFLSQKVFRPLEMTRTVLGLGELQISQTVRCQTEDAAPESGSGSENAKEWDWNSPYWRNLAAPWGGAHASASDVARFLESFLRPDGSAVSEAAARKMIQDHNAGLDTPRGLGFALGPEAFGKGCSKDTFGHGGATGTLAWADPTRDIVCVILTSLPSGISKPLILKPVSDVISSIPSSS